MIKRSPAFRLIKLIKGYSNGKCQAEKNALKVDSFSEISEKEFSAIWKDIIKQYVLYGFSMEEYVSFDFRNKTSKEKKEYISQEHRINLFAGRKSVFPWSKFERCELTKWLYLRDIIHVTFHEEAEKEKYADFISKHSPFIVKPCKGGEGRGVQRLSSEDAPNLDALKSLVGTECLLEEMISQGAVVSDFHPSSINTIRFVSGLNDKGEYSCIYALFRTGRGGSVVDNVGAGGIIAMIDSKTGKIISDGICGTEFYKQHPDTGKTYKGTVIPHWDDLLELAEESHKRFPEQRIIGWDWAWTEAEKWDLVETNPCPSFQSYQKLTQRGIKPLLRELGLM